LKGPAYKAILSITLSSKRRGIKNVKNETFLEEGAYKEYKLVWNSVWWGDVF